MRWFATLVLAYAAPAAAQMVSSADVKAQVDTTGSLPDTVSVTADLDAIAGKYRPEIKVDEFDKHKSTILLIGQWVTGPSNKRITTKCTRGGDGDIAAMRLAHFEYVGKPRYYVIYVSLIASSWIFTGDDPFQVLADSSLIEFPSGAPASRSVGYGGIVNEDVVYKTTWEQLRRLAAARAIKSRIQGKDGDCTFQWRGGTIAALRQFVVHEAPAP